MKITFDFRIAAEVGRLINSYMDESQFHLKDRTANSKVEMTFELIDIDALRVEVLHLGKAVRSSDIFLETLDLTAHS